MPTAADYTAKIAGYRAKVESKAMPSTFEIVRDTEVSDSAGGYTTTTVAVASGMCRLRALGLQPNERAVADRLGWVIAYAIDLPYEVNVTPADRIVIGGSRTMEVGGVVDEDVWSVQKTVVAREVG